MLICPHCNNLIADSLIISESQRLIRIGKPNLKSAANGKHGGRPRSKSPTKSALYKRASRGRLKKVTAKK